MVATDLWAVRTSQAPVERQRCCLNASLGHRPRNLMFKLTLGRRPRLVMNAAPWTLYTDDRSVMSYLHPLRAGAARQSRPTKIIAPIQSAIAELISRRVPQYCRC
jgi:hypothetical protein